MDILNALRPYECYCGTESAFDFVSSYILEHSDLEPVICDSHGKISNHSRAHTYTQGAQEQQTPQRTSDRPFPGGNDFFRILRESDLNPVKPAAGAVCAGYNFKVAVISDRIVSGYYYNKFENQFITHGIKPVLISVDCSDNSKNLSAVEQIYKYLTDFSFGNGDWIVALGGGSIIDAAGFAASIFSGGIHYIVVPTTLGAMCDTSIAPNARLNCGSHKNELSVSVKPDFVMIDPSFLPTVPEKYRHNGFAYIVRLALLQDSSLLTRLLSVDDSGMREFIADIFRARSIIEKKNPFLLTVGDELAEAIESYFRFLNYSDGEALALSLLTVMDEERKTILIKYYERLGLPTRLTGVSGKTIMKLLEERIASKPGNSISLVLYEAGNAREAGEPRDVQTEAPPPGRWVIRHLHKNDAVKEFRRRLAGISDLECE